MAVQARHARPRFELGAQDDRVFDLTHLHDRRDVRLVSCHSDLREKPAFQPFAVCQIENEVVQHEVALSAIARAALEHQDARIWYLGAGLLRLTYG